MRRKYLCGIALILLSLSTVISAQTVDPYILSLTDASGGTGVPLGIDVFLESNAGQVQGWSFGVCHDDEVLEYVGAIEGPATLTAKNGAPADFTMVNEVVGGMTMGTVICFTACATLPQGMYELLEISYVPIASAGTSTSVSFCSTLGFPVIHTVVVVNGASQIPTQISGTIDVVSPNDLVIGTAYGPPGLTVSVPVRLTSVVPVDGIQVAFTFDPAVLTLVSVDPVGPALNADFFALPAGLAPGEVGFGLVMDISPPLDNQLPSGDDIQILDARFEIAPGALAPLTSTLAFAPSVGAPPLSTTLVSGQTQELPNLFDGSVEVVDYRPFVRGDCNHDQIVNIADGITSLYYLFVGTVFPTCLDACDVNDDAFLDTADPITIFSYQFSGGPPPPPPFPVAGIDPTPGEGIGCDGDIDDQ